MQKAVDSFTKYQLGMEQKFRSWEEEWGQKEIEMDEKRRMEDKQHEIQLWPNIGKPALSQQTSKLSYCHDMIEKNLPFLMVVVSFQYVYLLGR